MRANWPEGCANETCPIAGCVAGVGVSHHALSDFRVDHGQLLDKLLTDSVTTLAADGAYSDAATGAGWGGTCGPAPARRHSAAARQSPGCATRWRSGSRSCGANSTMRGRAAQRRARKPGLARPRRKPSGCAGRSSGCRLGGGASPARQKDRIDRKTGREKEPRVSPTDPDARVMRMAAGAFRPAYNVQMGCDPDSLVVVDVGLEPQRCRQRPGRTDARAD